MSESTLVTLASVVFAAGGFYAGVKVGLKSLNDKLVLLKNGLEDQLQTFHANLKENLNNLKTDLKEDIARLEQEQRKCNNIKERITRTEESSKSAHHRIDGLEKQLYEHHD